MQEPRNHTPHLFLDEVSKTDEALSTFIEIQSCSYQYKYLGSSGQNENMTCDCHQQWNSKIKRNIACGEDSECINRATSVECINDECGCGNDCQNQRFQRRMFAPVSVFQTELKGYGLRADRILYENNFIYEYIGEVINEDNFRKRMIAYDEKNFKHFYFMMLKKDAFIDATIKGSLARFVNHSCNPNAYVDKWVVGDKLRMGIFAKRTIQKGEEITFDYNVDRYGAQSQPCYCGEPNCIKFMGGKTQTDAALLLPEGISDALGVTVQQEKQWLKENKHKRKQQQKDDSTINEEFVKSIQVTGLTDIDVTKVMASLMKSQDNCIIKKLIERIYLTNDDYVNLSIVKIHGYKTFSTILQQDNDVVDDEIIIMILQILSKWPKLTRNKISSSKIEDVIRDISSNTTNQEISQLSDALLQEWLQLQMAYRIPKNVDNLQSLNFRSFRSHSPEIDDSDNDTQANGALDDLPPGWNAEFSEEHNSYYYYNTEQNLSQWEKPVNPKVESPTKARTPKTASNFNDLKLAQLEEERLQREKELLFNEAQNKQKHLQLLINESQKQAEERKAVEAKIKAELLANEKAKKAKRSKSKHSSLSRKPNNLILWSTLFAKHVPNFIKKYQEEIGRDNVKGCARDVVKLLTDKELAKDAVTSPPSELNPAKVKKTKEFTKSYMDKFLVKYRKKHSHKKPRVE